MRRLPCSAKYRVALCSNPHCARSHAHALEPPPKGPPSPGTEPSTCYDPALAALLHASPIASRWRRRRILARRNLIRQAAPPGPFSERVPPKARNQTKRPLPAAAPRALLPCFPLLFCFCLLPTLLYHPTSAVATALNSLHTFFCSPKLDTHTHNPRRPLQQRLSLHHLDLS